MSVLQRDLDSYQSALDRYRLQVRQHNNFSNQYNNSLLQDANGNVYVRNAAGQVFLADAATGQLSNAALPDGKTIADYGATQAEANSPYYVLRVNPIKQQYKTVSGVGTGYDADTGEPTYYAPDGTVLPAFEYKIIDQKQVQVGYDYENNQPIYNTTYTIQKDASTYATNPGKFDKTFDMKAPSVTAGQLRKMSTPSLATQERNGLISSEIIGGGGGVLSGNVQKVKAPEKPPEVVNPVDPAPYDYNMY